MTEQTKHSLELEEELALCRSELETTRATLAREKEARREAETILDERNKELNCLYDLSKLGERPDLSLPELLRAIVYRLPAAWQYPEIAGARLTYYGETYQTPNFAETPWQQRSPLMHQERRVGELTICYTEKRPPEAIGPFLAEEQELLEAVVEYIERIIERRETTSQLQASEARFRRAVLEAPFPMMIHTEDGKVLQINHVWTELTGYTQEEIPTIGDWMERAYGERQGVVKAHIDQLYDQDTHIQEGEYGITTKEGERRIWEFHSAPLGASPDGRRQVLSIAMDITERKRAEATLRCYKLAVESSTDSIVIIAPDYTYVLANENYLRYHQLRRDEVLGHSVEKVVGEEIFQTALPYLKRAFAGEQPRYEITYPYPGMGERTLTVSYSPLRDNGNGIIGVVAVLRDITERKHAETQLRTALIDTRRRENEMRWLLSASQSILASHTFEVAARQIFDAACEVTGAVSGYVALLSEDGAENELVFLEAGGLPCDVDPELPMPIRGLRSEAYHKGEVVYDNDFMSSEWMKFMPGGHVELRNVLFAPLTIDNRVVGVIGLANKPTDFTEDDAKIACAFGDLAAIALDSVRKESALRESERRFRLIAEHAQDLIYRIRLHPDRQFEYVSPSATKITGYTPEEHYADPNLGSKLVHPEDRPKLQQTGQAPSDAPLVLRWVRKDGRVIWMEQQNTPIYDDEGRMVALEGIARDITARKEMAQQLQKYAESLEEQVAEKVRELEKAQIKMVQTAKLASLGEMATGVAHELNQPLTSMLFDADYLRSWAQQAQQAQREDEDQCPVDFGEIYQIGEDFISDIDRCRRITDYLRSFRRLTRGEPVRFDLNQAIEGSLTLARARLIQHGVEFQSDLTPNRPSIYAHPGQIEHVFLNLIHNAERALAEMARRIQAGEVHRPDYQKRLTIATRLGDEGEYVIAAVHDNGCGIPPEAQAELFQPFFTTKAFGEGTGLGLTISHSIVQEFNGEIAVESTKNVGTTFIVRFPIVDEG